MKTFQIIQQPQINHLGGCRYLCWFQKIQNKLKHFLPLMINDQYPEKEHYNIHVHDEFM